MPASVFGGGLFIILGLILISHGLHGAPLNRPSTRLWRVARTIAGLGTVGFGLTALVYGNIVVPANAPLVSRVIWTLNLIWFVGGSCAAFIEWLVARRRQHPAAHRELPYDV